MATYTNTSRPQEDFSKAKNQAGQMADAAKDKASDIASNVADKAKDVASNVADRAKNMASNLGHKAEDATHAVGSSMQSLGGTVREKLPHEGAIGAAASSIAGSLESGGQYLKEEGLSGIAEDVTNMIRRNPVPAMLVGLALGFIIARATTRS
jgi:gas vesicle protein